MSRVCRAIGTFLLFCLIAGAADAVSFSHKAHAPLKLKCTSCHTGADTEVRAGSPDLGRCQTCHVSMKDRATTESASKLPDFVNFSHVQHAAAKLECSACHGEAYKQSAAVMKPVRMKACVDCHKVHKATVACNVCHELGQ
jgi:hypothetical protein